jgi:hypothetical protein
VKKRKSEDRKADRPHDSAECAGKGGQGDQVNPFWIFDFGFWIREKKHEQGINSVSEQSKI